MILSNKNYIKNLKRHRQSNFLNIKIKFDKDFVELKKNNKQSIESLNKISQFYNKFETRSYQHIKSQFPLKSSFENPLEFLKTLNKDKVDDFLQSINIINKKNNLLWVKWLSIIFSYVHLYRFFFELMCGFYLLYYIFKTGTFF